MSLMEKLFPFVVGILGALLSTIPTLSNISINLPILQQYSHILHRITNVHHLWSNITQGVAWITFNSPIEYGFRITSTSENDTGI